MFNAPLQQLLMLSENERQRRPRAHHFHQEEGERLCRAEAHAVETAKTVPQASWRVLILDKLLGGFRRAWPQRPRREAAHGLTKI